MPQAARPLALEAWTPFRFDAVAQRHFGDYARKLADEMGLRDWTIELRHEPPEIEGSLATSTFYEGRKLIAIRVCEHFAGLDPADQRHVFVHEFIHPHLQGLVNTVSREVPSWMPPRTFELFERVVKIDLEFAVDALAAVLAPHMPVPPPVQ